MFDKMPIPVNGGEPEVFVLAERECAELNFIELHQLLLFLKKPNDYGYLSIPYAIDVHQEIL